MGTASIRCAASAILAAYRLSPPPSDTMKTADLAKSDGGNCIV
jgi:hypothetical protein